MPEITITRMQLYDQVWSTPMMQFAKSYNLFDVGLAKICKNHDIPRPPRGYWAKLQHGNCVDELTVWQLHRIHSVCVL